MSKFASSERESTINMNNAEETAQIYTCQPYMQRKLEKLAADYPDEVRIIRSYPDHDGLIIKIPKKWVKIRPTKTMTPENARLYSFRFRKNKE